MADGRTDKDDDRNNEIEAPHSIVQPLHRASLVHAPSNRRRFGSLRLFLLLFGPAAAIGCALWLYLGGGRFVGTDDAYVRAAKMIVAADEAGTVAEVMVVDNQQVFRGQPLFRLDDEPSRIALSEAAAALDATANDIATLQATYRQNLAQIRQAQTDVEYYESADRRQEDLSRRGVASQANLDSARRDLDAARGRLDVARRQADVTASQLGGATEGKVTDHPRYRQAAAKVEAAQRDVRHTVVAATMAGIVTNVDNIEQGAYLTAGQAAIGLISSERVWIEANLKETDLTHLKPGDPAEVTIDAYPGRTWRGKVDSVDPATGAEFSALPAQNSSGNWVKVVQRVAVRLAVDVPADSPPLRSGMSADVSVDTGYRRSFEGLVENVLAALGLCHG